MDPVREQKIKEEVRNRVKETGLLNKSRKELVKRVQLNVSMMTSIKEKIPLLEENDYMLIQNLEYLVMISEETNCVLDKLREIDNFTIDKDDRSETIS